MIVSRGDGDFFAIERASSDVCSYIKWSITPTMYRYYENAKWYIHKDHLLDVVQLGYAKDKVVDYSQLSTPWRKCIDKAKLSWTKENIPTISDPSDSHSILYLTSNVPEYILEAVWRAVLKKNHPDVGGDPEVFMKMKKAYEDIKRKRR